LCAPAVERPQPEHELLQHEGFGEVVVGPQLEPRGLVVDPVGRGQHQDRHTAPGCDDAPGDLITRRAGDIAVEYGNVICIDPQELQRHFAVTGDVGRDRFQTQPIANRL